MTENAVQPVRRRLLYMPASLRPHKGIGPGMAHRTAGVLRTPISDLHTKLTAGS